MKLILTQGKYKEGIRCCEDSLLNRGELLPREKESDHDYGIFRCRNNSNTEI